MNSKSKDDLILGDDETKILGVKWNEKTPNFFPELQNFPNFGISRKKIPNRYCPFLEFFFPLSRTLKFPKKSRKSQKKPENPKKSRKSQKIPKKNPDIFFRFPEL